jgi:hypothetical protein
MLTRTRPRNRALPQAARIALAAITLLVVLSAGFFLSSVIYGAVMQDTACPPLLGNRPENLGRLEGGAEKARPFSFLVVGDTKTSDTFENFYNNVRLGTDPDFGIIMGDFVPAPEWNRHRFFMHEFSEWGMRFPIILIAGNHDIVTDQDVTTNHVKDLSDPFYPSDFEKTYGPMNFSFTYAGCLFIGLCDVYNASYIDYLRDVLSREAGRSLMTFVIMHIPPQSLSPAVEGRGIEREEEFYDLVEEYRVDYVFSGDFHSYFRSDRGWTKYIITGGGGEDLFGGTKRSFYHVLFMTVDPEARRVDEIIYPIERTADIGDDIEVVLLAQLYPLFETRPLLWAVLFSVIILLGLAGMVWLLAGALVTSPKTRTRGRI